MTLWAEDNFFNGIELHFAFVSIAPTPTPNNILFYIEWSFLIASQGAKGIYSRENSLRHEAAGIVDTATSSK